MDQHSQGRSSDTPNQTARPSARVEILTEAGLWQELGLKPTVPETATDPSTAASKRYTRIPFGGFRVGTLTTGVLFTALIHLLLVTAVVLGTAGRPQAKDKITPLAEGAAASAQNSEATEFVSMLILIDNHSITDPDQPDDSVYAAAEQALQEALPHPEQYLSSLNPPTLPQLTGSEDGTDEQSPTPEATGNAAGRALMFGRYMGQIQARIERAWEHPFTTDPMPFKCKAQIKQDPQGNVKEVTLQNCGDDPAWQLSLVQAIQRASPLSAPPDESVFTEIVSLSFDAQPTVQLASTVADRMSAALDDATHVESIAGLSLLNGVSAAIPPAPQQSLSTVLPVGAKEPTIGPGVHWGKDAHGNYTLTIIGTPGSSHNDTALPPITQQTSDNPANESDLPLISAPGPMPEPVTSTDVVMP